MVSDGGADGDVLEVVAIQLFWVSRGTDCSVWDILGCDTL